MFEINRRAILFLVSLVLFSGVSSPSQAALTCAQAAGGLVRQTAPALPKLTQDPTHLAVFGAGDVVLKYYSPAFRQLLEEYGGPSHVSVTFIDNSKFAQGNPAMMAKREKIIAEIEAWGGKVLDRNNPWDEKALHELKPDVVWVATPDHTHASVAGEAGALFPEAKSIVVEKPVDSSLVCARALAGANPLCSRLVALDHTLARLPSDPATKRELTDYLGNHLKDFTFYFLEDGSGADPYGDSGLKRDGAIEQAQRVKTLDGGIMLDLMPHVLAVVGYFGDVESVKVLSVDPMQYTGVDGDPNKRTEIKGDTFAKIAFTFRDDSGNLVNGTAYVGKGIRGVKALGPQYDHNVKVVDITGANGAQERLDLRSKGEGNSTATLRSATGQVEHVVPLNPIPYYSLIRGMIAGNRTGTMPIKAAVGILESIETMRGLGQDHSPTMPTYPGGMAAVPGVRDARQAPYLEDVVGIFQRQETPEPMLTPRRMAGAR